LAAARVQVITQSLHKLAVQAVVVEWITTPLVQQEQQVKVMQVQTETEQQLLAAVVERVVLVNRAQQVEQAVLVHQLTLLGGQ
jgi:hypothetical protein